MSQTFDLHCALGGFATLKEIFFEKVQIENCFTLNMN